MLRIVKDGFSADTHGDVAREVNRIIETGGRAYMLVPEQQTVMSECKMAELLPQCAPRFFEVTNFSRFADTTFRSIGGLAGEYCDKPRRELIMWRTLTELSPSLSMTGGKREIAPGVVERAMAAVKETEALGLSAEELSEAAKSDSLASDPRLRDKLIDLSVIRSLYKKLISERYADSGELLAIMADRLLANPEFLSGYEIFIEGFTSFTEPQYRLISLLSSRCTVTVYLTVSRAAEEFFEFREIKNTEQRLRSAAKDARADVKITSRNTGRVGEDVISAFADMLWCKLPSFDKISLQKGDEIAIYEAREPYEECDFLCADIKRKVMEGASFSDFAIIARRAEDYAGILNAALKKADLPAFTSYKKDASSFEPIKLIYTAYSIIRTGFSREDVLTYAKCSPSSVSREAVDEFETYVTTWQITGSRFTDGSIWNMNPDGYSTRRREGADELLCRINETKNLLITPLIKLKVRAEAAKTAREQAVALFDFLTELDIEQSLTERARALSLLGEEEFAEENKRLWKLICDSLDTIVEIQGDTPCDSDGFLSQLKILFSSLNIGKIPAYRDEITVGSADMIRLFDKKHVYLLGVSDGEFPATVNDDSYFSERDKELLSGLGLSIRPDLEIKNARELYIFTRAFSYAKRSVTLLYPAASTRMKAVGRSAVIDRIISLSGGEIKVKKISALAPSDKIYTPEYALRAAARAEGSEAAAIDRALEDAGWREVLDVSRGNIKNGNLSLGEDICRKFRERALSLTQSRIDSFVNCPLAHFCRYTIRLSEDKRAELDAPGIGSFIHAVLENFFRSLEREGISGGQLGEGEIKERTHNAAKEYVEQLGEDIKDANERTKIKLERLSRAAYPILLGLCREFGKSSFRPTFFELAIGREKGLSADAITITPQGEREINVYGVIDRVDTYKSDGKLYVRVVDYKTGQKDFSPEDIEKGENLQMLLYLKSVIATKDPAFRSALGAEPGDEVLPAGVIYLKTSLGDVRVDRASDSDALELIEAAMEREGMVLNDDDVLNAMGLRYTPVYSARTPNKIPDSKKKFLFEPGGYDGIMEKVEDSVERLAKRMRCGDISAKAELRSNADRACEYCKFKPICRQAVIK